jgi:hypothetical protein
MFLKQGPKLELCEYSPKTNEALEESTLRLRIAPIKEQF